MNFPPKIVSTIKAALMSIMTLITVIGLSQWAGFLDVILTNYDQVIQALELLIGFGLSLWMWIPSTDAETKGQLMKKEYKNAVSAASGSRSRAGYFRYKQEKKAA